MCMIAKVKVLLDAATLDLYIFTMSTFHKIEVLHGSSSHATRLQIFCFSAIFKVISIRRPVTKAIVTIAS